MSRTALSNDDAVAELLLEQSRARRTLSLAQRERVSRWAAALLLLVAGGLLLAFSETHREPPLVATIALVVLFAAASRVEFELGGGSAVPTQLVFVPMLFVLPAASLPLLVALGLVVGGLPDYVRGNVHPERIAALVGSACFAFGPALVFVAAGEPDPTWGSWPWLVAALAAQFAADGVSTAVREWTAVRVPPRALVQPLGWVFMVDALLAPVGFAAVLAAGGEWYGILLAAPLLLLVSIFARERQARLDQSLELSHAYRGTAFLLGDVVEADDQYTGLHSRDVLELVLAVCDRLGVDLATRRKAEFAALLHDVGKIRIPKEIVNKPAGLDDEERALMQTHTIEGERLLERVGGLLREVGTIVRSCHEHYDGSGYPDGLVGDEIPLVARVVTCCDAFNAMTTDRPYRVALSIDDALAEIARCSGTQFDPDVVEALAQVVRAS